MVAKSTLQIIIEAITGDAVKGIDKVDDDLKNLGKTADKTSAQSNKIADSMGGIKKAFSVLATSGIILKAGGMLIDFFKSSVVEAEAAAEAQAQLEAVIRSTGGAAGLTSEDIEDMAGEMSKATGVEDDLIKKNSALLLTFTKVGKKVFPQAMEAAIDMSAVLGQDLQSSVTQLGKALNDPIEGVTALRRVGVAFNEEQQNMIEKLVESGDLMGAQTFILQELQTEFGGAAESIYNAGTKSDGLTNAIGNLKETIGGGLIPEVRDANEKLTELVDGITDNITVVSEYREALEDGIITQAEFNEHIEINQGGMYAAADAHEWLKQKTGETTTATWNMRDALQDNAMKLDDEESQAYEAAAGIDAVAEASINAKDAMRKYSDELLFNMASAGLDEEAALALALSMGLVDKQTYNAMLGVEDLTEKYDLNKNGAIDAGLETALYAGAVEALRLEIEALEDKTVNITANINKTGDWSWVPNVPGMPVPKAGGGPVYSGSPYLVGEEGPELFVPTLDGQIIPNQQTTNNFNLTMTSNAPVSTLARDFSIMQSMAGA